MVAALNGLRTEGYTTDFNIQLDKLICTDNKIILHPEDFEITKVFRFEGDSNPDDEEVVYAIESKDGKIKGVFVSAYGRLADSASNKMLKKLSMHTQ